MSALHLPSAFAGAALLGLLAASQGPVVRSHGQLVALTPEQQEILSHMSIVYMSDGQGGMNKTIRFTGTNVQIVNGLGATNGNPANPYASVTGTAANGLGNLIIGYNEFSTVPVGLRTGSHNLAVGIGNTYTSF